jgi:hypothetical protein
MANMGPVTPKDIYMLAHEGTKDDFLAALADYVNWAVTEVQGPKEAMLDIGNPRFLELNAEEAAIHRAKAAGYSGSDNPDTWANFREATMWGLTPLQGCLVRMGDKYRRAQNLMRNPANEQVGETLKDTLMDMSNYAKIAICLWEEEQQVALEQKVGATLAAVGEELSETQLEIVTKPTGIWQGGTGRWAGDGHD